MDGVKWLQNVVMEYLGFQLLLYFPDEVDWFEFEHDSVSPVVEVRLLYPE